MPPAPLLADERRAFGLVFLRNRIAEQRH